MVSGPSRRSQLLRLAGGVVVVVALLTVLVVGVSASTTGSEMADRENVTVYTSDGDFDDTAAVETAIANGTVEPTDVMVRGRTMVLAIDSERLASTLAAGDGPTTERFFEALGDDVYFALVQQNAEPNVRRKAITLDRDSTTVYRNETTTYLSVDTDQLTVESFPPWEEGGSDRTLYDGDRFAVLLGDDPDDLSGEQRVTFVSVEAELDDPPAVVAPERVAGTVRTYASLDGNLTLRTTVENGSAWTTTLSPDSPSVLEYSLDFRPVAHGTNYTLELRDDGGVLDRHEGTVRTPDGTLRDADVRVLEGDTIDARVTVRGMLTHGGTVVVRDGFGARLGSTTVPPGEAVDLSVDLRFGEDGPVEPDTLHVVAVRPAGDIEQRYPGPDATLTLDVSEYEWATDDWTHDSETNASDRVGPENKTGGDEIRGGDRSDGGADEGPTVGTPSSAEQGLAGFGTTAGVVGLVLVLCSTGYLLRRQFL